MFSRSCYEKAASALLKVSRMSFLPIENRYRRIVKALAFLVTFTRYREMENEGDKTRRRVDGGRKKGALQRVLSVRTKLINFSRELNFQHYCINRYRASLRT